MKRPYAESTRAFLAAGLAVLTAHAGLAETIDTSGTVERSDNFASGLTKKGTGTVRLTGEAQTVTGAFETQAGTSKVEGSLSVSGWVGVDSFGTLQIPGALSCAAGAGLWMNQGAQTSVSGNLVVPNILAVKGGTFRQTDGTVNVTSYEVDKSAFGIGGYDWYETGYAGTYELSGGTLNVNPNFHIGRYSPGTFLQTGGTANIVGVPSVGRYATGVGVAKHTGGIFNQTTLYRGYIVGEEGSGELTVDGDATVNVLGQWGVALGSNAAKASGTLKLYGGTLAAQKIQGGYGTSRAVLNGGTLKALTDTTTFVTGVGACEVGEAGVTIDTDGHTVSNACPIVAMTPPAAKLTHRWSFNGSWDDSVGGGTATKDGGAAFNAGATACVLPGGAKGAGAVNLGTGLLPAGDKGFTLEFWMTENAIQSWCRAFSVGPNVNNCIWMAFTYATQLERSCFAVVESASSALWLDNTLGGFGPQGTEYHVAVVAEPKGDGSYRFSIYKQNAVTGETLAKDVAKDAPAGWTPALLDSAPFWLGRSLEANNDASASYNEVRIWDAPLSEEELSCKGRMGPDRLEGAFVKKGAGELALAGANTFTTPVRVEAGTLSLPAGATVAAPVTVEPGAVLAVEPGNVPSSITVRVSATEAQAGCIEARGAALDLATVPLAVANVADLDQNRSYVVVRSDAGFVGEIAASGLPKRWRYEIRGNTVVLRFHTGLSLFVR